MHNDTFVSYRRMRFFWINFLILAIFVAAYLLSCPVGGANGDTWFGYTSGTFAALAIVWLTWFGIRKRSYYRSSDTVKGWLAFHIWLGLILIVIVPLHSAFRFGPNIHSLAYALMCIVIISGTWGAFIYRRFATDIPSHRGEGSPKEILMELRGIESQIAKLIVGKSDLFDRGFSALGSTHPPSILNALGSKGISPIIPKQLAKVLTQIPAKEKPDAEKLIALAHRKLNLQAILNREIRSKLFLKLWLYIHIPCTFALLSALVAHIFFVFYYY